MRGRKAYPRIFVGTLAACLIGLFGVSAEAASNSKKSPVDRPVLAKAGAAKTGSIGKLAPTKASAKAGAGYLTCVPYAREVSGMALKGDGWMWWSNSVGQYARGQRPAPGSVLVFQRSGGMVHGHVAVVRQIINSREIRVDHANWAPRGGRKGRIEMGVAVRDVSKNNDWTKVHVWYAPVADYGQKAYPTYGFVYGAPDRSGAGETEARALPETLPQTLHADTLPTEDAFVRPVATAQEEDPTG